MKKKTNYNSKLTSFNEFLWKEKKKTNWPRKIMKDKNPKKKKIEYHQHENKKNQSLLS